MIEGLEDVRTLGFKDIRIFVSTFSLDVLTSYWTQGL